jgi:hypothetical protein
MRTSLSVFLAAPLLAQDGAPNRFDEMILKAAAEYRTYGRVDDQTRWAPYLCKRPPPSQARFSESDDDKSHGQKLYFLFAKNREEYLRPAAPQKVGQILVKESWIPVPAEKDDGHAIIDPPDGKLEHRGSYRPYASKDGKLFRADKRAELFLMMKLDPATPGTDKGWLYAVVSTDLKKVVASGALQSCIKCHRDAEPDRLFGLPKPGK